ncbi:MAG: tripartite tricarboxylate transporter TctB family protein [Betaproteobacteria bacterium]
MGWIKGPKDFWSGVVFMTFGAIALVVSSTYRMGTAARMGPGYFPRALGALLLILGAIIAVRGLRSKGEPLPAFVLRPLVFVLGTVVVFGLVVPWSGVVLGTLFLIFVSSYASHEFRWKEAVVSGVLLAAAAVLVFIVGLQLQLPIWPWPWNQ